MLKDKDLQLLRDELAAQFTKQKALQIESFKLPHR
jgi:hypothetical protein